jgi:thermitase
MIPFLGGLLHGIWKRRFIFNTGVVLGLVGGLVLFPIQSLPSAVAASSLSATPATLSKTELKQGQVASSSSHRIIIKMRQDFEPLVPTGYTTLDASMERFDVQSVAPLFDLDRGDATLKQGLGLDRVYVLTLPSSSNLRDALAAFSADPAVVYAEPDFIGYGAGIPNDQYFTYQWNLDNTGQSGGDPDADVDAPEAWDISLGAASTVLAVIDTGADLDHPDLAGNLVSGASFVTYTVSPQDDHGHGTHVAGVAAAVTNNGVGAAGICPNCKVMPLKALNDDNWGYYSWWIGAIEYAVDNGAQLINMSMGGTDYSHLLHDAVRYAYDANVPIVAAMMNNGDTTLYYPAAFTETIAIGATDRYDDRSDFSNYGDHIDLVAPGTAILSTLLDDTYAIWDGTSMATPHVAGTIGLINSVRPGYTIEELRAILRATAEDQVGPPSEDKAGWDEYFGAGRLNVAQAVQYVVPPVEMVIDGSTEGIISVDYALTAAVSPITASQPISYVWQATGQAPVVHTGGLSDTVSFVWPTPGVQTITVTATNFGGVVTGTRVVTVTPPPPVTDLTVCLDGGCDYDNIQAAVDAVDDGGTIRVAAGTYTGVNSYDSLAQVVYISKSITIRGGYTTAFTDPPDPTANPTIVDAQGDGRALYIIGLPVSGAGISPTIEGLHITGGDADGLLGGLGAGDSGGGICALNAQITISDSRIFSNTARWGGGLYLEESDAVLTGNTIVANAVDKDGGGLYLRVSDATLDANTVVSNAAAEQGAGLYLYESDATLKGNTVTINTADKDGGGLYLWRSDATLDGNAVVANTAAEEGGGLYLGNSDATLTNNVVADNQADVAGSGLYVRGSSPHLLHTTVARNDGGDGIGVYVTGDVGDRSSATLANTILVNHTVGITVTDGNTATLEATLWGEGNWANTTDWEGAGMVTLTHDHWGAPAFVAPDTGDYHIGVGSAALNTGVDVGVTTDVDGDPRPIGPGHDLGADEFPTALSASLEMAQRASTGVAQAGAQLTYTIHVTNTGDVYLYATVTDVLPSHVSPGGVRTWTPVVAPDSSWVETVIVTVEAGYTGPLTNEVQVTTEEGVGGTDVSTVVVVEEVVTVEPSEGGILIVTAPDGMSVTIEIPAGAVAEPTQLAYASLPTITGSPPDFSFAGRAFSLDAYRDGVETPGLVFGQPITVTIDYTSADVAGLDENTLELRYWDGGSWSADGIMVVERNVTAKRLVTQVEHLSEFATFAKGKQPESSYKICLPLVVSQYP